MIVWAMKSLPFVDLPNRSASTKFKVLPSDLVFISLNEQEKKYKITSLLKNIFGNEINVLLIPEVTRGALETSLVAKDFMTDEEIIISDSDHYFDGTNLYRAILNKEENISGVIPVFQPPDNEPKWSYMLFDKNKTALAVGEKDAELAKKGAYANIGAYYFSSGKTFKENAQEVLDSNEMFGPDGKQEFYVAPLYQKLINKGMKIKAAITPHVWGLGTPKDLEFFIANFKN